jgi:hypothetical protein
MDSLQVTDDTSAAVATHPRVTLQEIKDSIIWETYVQESCLFQVLGHASVDWNGGEPPPTLAVKSLSILTICILVHKNGFTVIGKAAPASPENFDPKVGRQFAYEDAIRQLWPLMGFSLRDKLATTYF